MPVTAQPTRSVVFKFNDGTARTLTGLIDASVTWNVETIETTELASVDKTFIPGQRSATMQGSCYYDQSDAVFAALEAAVKAGAQTNGTPFTMTVEWQFTGSTVVSSYTANCIFTSWTVSAAMLDTVKASFTAQLSGAVAIA